jgi:hypothetical protein
MSNLKLGISIALAFAVSIAYITPIWAVDYNPGVSVGQWVKYGNFVAMGTGVPSEFNKTDWMKIDVVAISGKNVTLHMSGKLKNGTDTMESGAIVNVATGSMNVSSSGFLFIIPANLQKDDIIPESGSSFPVKINKTESRSYMGVNRNVGIFNMSASMEGVAYKYVMIWDQASGMLMELSMSMTSTYLTSKMSLSAIDTNIFATGTAGWLMDNIVYIGIAVIVIIVIIAAAAMITRRKPSAPSATETSTSET